MPARFHRWFVPTVLFHAALVTTVLSASPGPTADIHSHGNPQHFRVQRVDLDLTVDFERKILAGEAQLRFQRQPGCPPEAKLQLDSRDLTVEAVRCIGDSGQESDAEYEVGPSDPILGSRIAIAVPDGVGQVAIRYRTSPRAVALQWLEPAQTAGGRTPFLFTQSQAIQARSWVPLQDSPGVRISYGATIRVPSGLRAVMSADDAGSDPARKVFRFEMPQSIPPYLLALGVGDLQFRELGPRTGIWAEGQLLGKAHEEFRDTESMIEAVERRFGAYRWGRYDLLVLPPSFPFGGMENPKLTFLTPTVLAGDRSLVSLIAHELAHSWSGNLVSNATWRDFWLNEGVTTYLERRIIEEVFGVERARMEWVLGLQGLRSELRELPEGDQILAINLKGRDPDDGVTGVPYEKGALLLATLEDAFGRERFDSFLKAYFERFAFRSITTEDFVRELKAELFTGAPEIADRVDLERWLHQPGLPAEHRVYTSERLERVDRSAADWAGGTISAGEIEVKDWSFHEWLRFLRALPADLDSERLAALDTEFELTDSSNSEILAQWLEIAIRGQYRRADARLEEFLTSVGRRKFLVPLYTELAKTPDGKLRAQAIYARARPRYHPIAVNTVDRLLGKP